MRKWINAEHLSILILQENKCYNIAKDVRAPSRGLEVSEETRKKISKKNKKAWKNPKRKKRMSEVMLGENNPFYGKKHTSESRKKMSEARMKTYNVQLCSPDGKIYGPIKNLIEFCLEHNLTYNTVSQLLKGKIKRHKGWELT